MQTQGETSNSLERKIELSVSRKEVEAEVDERLKRLVPRVNIQGFRPGKVPLKIVARQYGQQIRQEVLGGGLQKQFDEIVKREGFRVAGAPNFESQDPSENNLDYKFGVTFEIYPDFALGDLSSISVSKPVLEVGEAEIDKTLDVLRKQRASYKLANRPAQSGDRASIDYHGVLAGKDFAGNQANNYSLILGDGLLLKDFEASVLGMNAGQEKTFNMTFPEDYPGKDVAGKEVIFTVRLNELEIVELPDVDDEFARLLGVQDGSVDRMRSEIKTNLQREISQRIRVRLKEQIMQSLLDKILIHVPGILVQQETDRLIEGMQNTRSTHHAARKNSDLPRDMLLEKAERRVRLGLILAKLIEVHKLNAKPEQVKSYIEEHSQGYENPEQVVSWHYALPERLQEIEPLVLEDNVVSWILERADVVDQHITFEELMGYPYATNV